MLTVEDVAAVPLFSALPGAELERLARTSADLRLSAGEFAVPEGGEPALFAVLSGKIEVVKTFDGIERTLGWRLPGTIFGEVPIALGTPFPGGYRAAEPSRVMRVDIQQYYAVAAVSKDISTKVSALARERIGGLQSITDEPPKPRATARRSPLGCGMRQPATFPGPQSDFLQLVDARRAGAVGALVRNPSSGGRLSGAAIGRWTGGQSAGRARGRQIASACKPVPRFSDYDVAVVGGGAAGLAAAVYGASEGLRTIVIEREAPGGQAGTSSRIENYLGFPSGVSGDELASRALQQAKRLGAEILVTRSVVRVSPKTREVFLDGERRRPRKDPHSCHRRVVAPPRDRGPRPADRQGRLLWRRAQRSQQHAWTGHPPRRRRQLGRPGGAVFCQSRPQGHAHRARRVPGKEHVALPDRAIARQIQRRGSAVVGSQCRARRHAPDCHRHARQQDQAGAATRMRRPVHLHRRRRGDRRGCPPTSPAMRADMC